MCLILFRVCQTRQDLEPGWGGFRYMLVFVCVHDWNVCVTFCVVLFWCCALSIGSARLPTVAALHSNQILTVKVCG